MEVMGLKALVTGGTGFIGSNLIIELIKRHWEVYALVRRNSSLGYKRLSRIKNIKYIYVDELFINYSNRSEENVYINEALKGDLPQFDVCFHLAAYGVDFTQQEIDEFINGNIKFTMRVLEFCKKNNTKKVINTGSCFEYGLNEGSKLNEEDKLNPQSMYGSVKAATCIIANSYCKISNIPLITVRPFGIYGENEGMNKLIPQVMKAVLLNRKMNMTSGEQIRDYLYVKDVIEAYITLAIKDIPFYEVYNICSGVEVRIKDLVKKVVKLSSKNERLFNFGAIPYRKGEVMYFVGDNSKIKKYTNWEPKYTLEEGLRRTFEWYMDNLEEI